MKFWVLNIHSSTLNEMSRKSSSGLTQLASNDLKGISDWLMF